MGLVVAAKGKTDRVIYLRLLWSQRRFLLRTGLCGLILSVFVALLFPVSYESETRLMPPEEGSSALAALAATAGGRGDTSSDQSLDDASMAVGEGGEGGERGSGSSEPSSRNASGGNLSGLGSYVLGPQTSGYLLMDALAGPTVEDELIQKFDLRHRYHVRYWEDARKVLAKRTKIKGDQKSGVISITVSDHDPYRAQQMATAYAQVLNALLAQVSTSSARRERIFLEQRLKDIKATLDATSQRFASFAGQTAALYVPSQTQAMVESEARLQAQLAAAESDLERLEQIYTDSNISVRRLRASVASLRREVESFTGNPGDPARTQPEIAGDLPSLRKLALVNVRWANLYRAFRIQDALYKKLTQEYELAKIQEAKEIPTVKVLDAALLPERKSFPPRLIMTALGSFLSFVLAGAFVISAAMWRHRESPEKRLAAEIWRQLSSELALSRAWLRHVSGSFGGRIGIHGGQG
jgi:uncharacterized protein involved in exopolysaccharide biosynthesis